MRYDAAPSAAGRRTCRLRSSGSPHAGNAARRAGDVEPGFLEAERLLVELGMPVMLAEVQVEHAEWLESAGRHDEAVRLLAPAVEALSRGGATPLLERAQAGTGPMSVGAPQGAPARGGPVNRGGGSGRAPAPPSP